MFCAIQQNKVGCGQRTKHLDVLSLKDDCHSVRFWSLQLYDSFYVSFRAISLIWGIWELLWSWCVCSSGHSSLSLPVLSCWRPIIKTWQPSIRRLPGSKGRLHGAYEHSRREESRLRCRFIDGDIETGPCSRWASWLSPYTLWERTMMKTWKPSISRPGNKGRLHGAYQHTQPLVYEYRASMHWGVAYITARAGVYRDDDGFAYWLPGTRRDNPDYIVEANVQSNYCMT